MSERLDPDMKRWADLLVNYSLASQFFPCETNKDRPLEGRLVRVEGEVCAAPLVYALEYSIVEAGGHPSLILHLPRQGLAVMEKGNNEQLTHVPKALSEVLKETDAIIRIYGSDEPDIFAPYSKQLAIHAKASEDVSKIRRSKHWVVTFYPTPSQAKLDGFESSEEYKRFILDACLVDYEKMTEEQDVIKGLMTKAKNVTVRSYDTNVKKIYELDMEIGSNIVTVANGKRNVPDGEVFTCPYAKTVDGEIFLDLPVMQNGCNIVGVYLNIEKGVIVDYNAQEGLDTLRAIIDADEGSHMIGEIAVGTNPKIQRALRHPLFVEKIGGTCHIAIGSSYDYSYNELQGDLTHEEKEKARELLVKEGRYSRSVLHIDFPKDFRTPHPGEALIIGDTEIVWRENRWIPK